MKYVGLVLTLALALYTLSQAKYNWSKKNKSAAVGAAILAVASIAAL